MILRFFAALAVLMLPAALFPAPAFAAPATNWLTTVTATPDHSHVLGNPNAKVRLIQFVSYTCPHCAHFEEASEAPLKTMGLANGTLSVEVRHMLRDPVDLAVALATNCGPTEKFFGNHQAFMAHQDSWIQPLVNPTDAQQKRWGAPDFATRMRNIAQDFGIMRIMAGRGYTPAQLDKCLTDKAHADVLAKQSNDDAKALQIDGTPSFAVREIVQGQPKITRLFGTFDWATLEPQLRARL